MAQQEIEQFCILARSQGPKSRACAALVQQANNATFFLIVTVFYIVKNQVLSHRKIFVFGEILELLPIASVSIIHSCCIGCIGINIRIKLLLAERL
jgi:hypothetical protein